MAAAERRLFHYFPISGLSRNIATDCCCYRRGKIRHRSSRTTTRPGARRGAPRPGHAKEGRRTRMPRPPPFELTILNFKRSLSRVEMKMELRIHAAARTITFLKRARRERRNCCLTRKCRGENGGASLREGERGREA